MRMGIYFITLNYSLFTLHFSQYWFWRIDMLSAIQNTISKVHTNSIKATHPSGWVFFIQKGLPKKRQSSEGYPLGVVRIVNRVWLIRANAFPVASLCPTSGHGGGWHPRQLAL